MKTRIRRFALIAAVGIVGLTVLGSQNSANAGLKIKLPKIKLPKIKLPKIKVPKIKVPKIDLKKLAPKVKFRVSARVSRGTVRLLLVADVRVAGKRISIRVLDMAVKKTRKSIQIKRKVGKLTVSLKISWSGTRTVTISGTARYLKFKVPLPKLRVRV